MTRLGPFKRAIPASAWYVELFSGTGTFFETMRIVLPAGDVSWVDDNLRGSLYFPDADVTLNISAGAPIYEHPTLNWFYVYSGGSSWDSETYGDNPISDPAFTWDFTVLWNLSTPWANVACNRDSTVTSRWSSVNGISVDEEVTYTN